MTAARAHVMVATPAYGGAVQLAYVQSLLGFAAAGIAYTSSVAVGPWRELLRRVGEREDIDRVLLGTRARDPFRRWRRQSVAHLMDRPVVSVS